jgi:transketolase
LKNSTIGSPKVLIADTIKGKGVQQLENDPLCHVKSLSQDEVAQYLESRYE